MNFAKRLLFIRLLFYLKYCSRPDSILTVCNSSNIKALRQIMEQNTILNGASNSADKKSVKIIVTNSFVKTPKLSEMYVFKFLILNLNFLFKLLSEILVVQLRTKPFFIEFLSE